MFETWLSVNYGGITITEEEFYKKTVKKIIRMIDWLNNQKAKEQAELEK
ncbi:hypothetical protein [Bernardetia sp.]|nr:hypothetical protein [Bernardetia sp.]